jgi:hypothetical protein
MDGKAGPEMKEIRVLVKIFLLVDFKTTVVISFFFVSVA